MMDRLVITSFWTAFVLFFSCATYQIEELRSFDIVAQPDETGSASRLLAVRATDSGHAGNPASWAKAILEKPLFSATRRPFVAEVHVVQPQAPRLSGIIISPSARLAIFAPDAGRQVIRQEGEQVDSFMVKQILPAKVVLVGAQGNFVVEPKFSAATSPATEPFRQTRGPFYGAMPPPDAASQAMFRNFRMQGTAAN
jgi:hypothetical protein